MTLTPDNLDGVGAETAAAGSVGSVPGEHRRLLIRGLTWSAAFQVFDVIVSFAAMLVLVRIIPPGDYGRVAAVLGVLGFVNLFNANPIQAYQNAFPGPAANPTAGWLAPTVILQSRFADVGVQIDF